MTDYKVQPMQVDRAIATLRLNGKLIEVFPSREYVQNFNALLQRNGGSDTDAVAVALDTAKQALALAQSAPLAAVAAYDAGAPASYVLDPVQPISVASINQTQARVSIAAHTRTPSGMAAIALNAGTVTISRGLNYSIYYNDPTDAGGAVTYLATEDPTVAGDYAAGNRLVGAAYLAPYVPPYGGRDYGAALP